MVTGEKPAPELHPPGVDALDLDDRADVDVLTRTGRRHVFDVRTVNVQRASAASTAAETQCAAIEKKCRHYGKYYRNFDPFVITLSGAVSQASAGALMRVMREVKRGDRYVLDWEPASWLEGILHRLSVDMVKTVAVIATRDVRTRPGGLSQHPTTPRPARRRASLCRDVRAAPCRALRAVPRRASSCHMM